MTRMVFEASEVAAFAAVLSEYVSKVQFDSGGLGDTVSLPLHISATLQRGESVVAETLLPLVHLESSNRDGLNHLQFETGLATGDVIVIDLDPGVSFRLHWLALEADIREVPVADPVSEKTFRAVGIQARIHSTSLVNVDFLGAEHRVQHSLGCDILALELLKKPSRRRLRRTE